MKGESRHQCFIYKGHPSEQLPLMAARIKVKLDEGYRCLYLNSPAMVAAMQSCLAARGFDGASGGSKSQLILSSEQMVAADGGFDIGLMLSKLASAVDDALRAGYKGLFATGDMTWEFASEKNFSKLMEYEFRLEELFSKCEALHGICQYHQDTLPGEATWQALLTHRMVVVDEGLSRVNPHFQSQEHLRKSENIFRF